MRIEQLGTGTPEVAIVGGIHGDEPCGARAVERLLDNAPEVHRPVKLIIANERALARNIRFIDTDLNRAFGSHTEESDHEHHLARHLADELAGCLTLSIHSTQSHAEPFGIVNNITKDIERICPYLSIVALVETNADEGRLFASNTSLIEIEAGMQGSETAIENAYRIAREFLTATDVLPGWTVARDLPVFRMDEPILKPPAEEYDVFVDNFTKVEAGEVFAAADGDPLVAEEAFYPILLSAYGYDTQFGYTGTHIGTLTAPTRPSTNE